MEESLEMKSPDKKPTKKLKKKVSIEKPSNKDIPPNSKWNITLFQNQQQTIQTLKEKEYSNPVCMLHRRKKRNAQNLLWLSFLKQVPEPNRQNPKINDYIQKYCFHLEQYAYNQFFVHDERAYSDRIRGWILHSSELCPHIFQRSVELMASMSAIEFLMLVDITGRFDRPEEQVNLSQKTLERAEQIKKLFPKADLVCGNSKCQKKNVIYYTYQRRSGDEPQDELFICPDCGWRSKTGKASS